MALRVTKDIFRLTSLLSSWESTLAKSAKAFTTNVNLELSLDEHLQKPADLNNHFKRYAMLIGYRGANYYGVCMNPGQDNIPTVGKEIVQALIKAGYANEKYLQSAKSISQASRTDTGVSALRQVLAIDLADNVDLDKIRSVLSEDIRVYGMARTVKRFVPFRFCEGRSYLYYIPSYVFSPHTMEMHKDYRLPSDTKDKLRKLLRKFLGRKNYHNFTRGRSFYDPRSERDITNIEFLEPIIKDGMELACIRLEGLSFILNQIRKIVGALVITGRGYAPEEFIDIALSKQGMPIGRAPPYGLMLENIDFKWYNDTFVLNGIEPIDFSKYEQEVAELRDRIISDVVSFESKYETTKLWVESLQYNSFQPYSKEQFALEACLEFDDTLTIYRSECEVVSGRNAAALFI